MHISPGSMIASLCWPNIQPGDEITDLYSLHYSGMSIDLTQSTTQL